MAENAPPAANVSHGDSSRGMPYYDKLRRDLRATLEKKRLLDQNLVCNFLVLVLVQRLI